MSGTDKNAEQTTRHSHHKHHGSSRSSNAKVPAHDDKHDATASHEHHKHKHHHGKHHSSHAKPADDKVSHGHKHDKHHDKKSAGTASDVKTSEEAKPTAVTNLPDRPKGDEDSEKFYDTIVQFMSKPDKTMTFSASQTGLQRKKVHALAEQFHLLHVSQGVRGHRAVTLTKISMEELKAQKEQEDIFRKIMKTFQEAARSSQACFRDSHGIPVVLDRSALHDHLRYVSWNIEWMDYFFASDTEMRKDNKANGVADVDELCRRIGGAILEMNPDVMAILEGPASLVRMQLFVQKFLDDGFHCFGGIDGNSQRIYIIVRKDCVVKNAGIYTKADEYLAQPWYFDLHGTLNLEEYNFIRRPVVVRGEVELDGEAVPIYFAAVHSKSKYIHGGKRLWEGSAEDKKAFIQKAIQNRRKIGSECGRLRKCLVATAHEDGENPMIIVSGDMNDGPGMDFFEEYYLLFDSVDVLMGNSFHQKAMLYPLLNQSHFVSCEDQYSCVFDDYVDKIKKKKVMLDHIFVSEPLRSVAIQAAFAHQLWEKNYDSKSAERQRYLSDHRPVFADFAIAALRPGVTL